MVKTSNDFNDKTEKQMNGIRKVIEVTNIKVWKGNVGGKFSKETDLEKGKSRIVENKKLHESDKKTCLKAISK